MLYIKLLVLFLIHVHTQINNIYTGGVLVSMHALGAIDCGFHPRLGQTKDYKIGNCGFSAIKARVLRRKSKDWLAQNEHNVSEWGNMSIRRLLFQ